MAIPDLYPTLHLADPVTHELIKVLSLENPTPIGRHSHATGGKRVATGPLNGSFDSPAMSRKHAMVWSKKGKMYISDTASAQGTFLNGVKIGEEKTRLMEGDHIDLGIDFTDPIRGDFKAIRLEVVPCPTDPRKEGICRCALQFSQDPNIRATAAYADRSRDDSYRSKEISDLRRSYERRTDGYTTQDTQRRDGYGRDSGVPSGSSKHPIDSLKRDSRIEPPRYSTPPAPRGADRPISRVDPFYRPPSRGDDRRRSTFDSDVKDSGYERYGIDQSTLARGPSTYRKPPPPVDFPPAREDERRGRSAWQEAYKARDRSRSPMATTMTGLPTVRAESPATARGFDRPRSPLPTSRRPRSPSPYRVYPPARQEVPPPPPPKARPDSYVERRRARSADRERRPRDRSTSPPRPLARSSRVTPRSRQSTYESQPRDSQFGVRMVAIDSIDEESERGGGKKIPVQHDYTYVPGHGTSPGGDGVRTMTRRRADSESSAAHIDQAVKALVQVRDRMMAKDKTSIRSSQPTAARGFGDSMITTGSGDVISTEAYTTETYAAPRLATAPVAKVPTPRPVSAQGHARPSPQPFGIAQIIPPTPPSPSKAPSPLPHPPRPLTPQPQRAKTPLPPLRIPTPVRPQSVISPTMPQTTSPARLQSATSPPARTPSPVPAYRPGDRPTGFPRDEKAALRREAGPVIPPLPRAGEKTREWDPVSEFERGKGSASAFARGGPERARHESADFPRPLPQRSRTPDGRRRNETVDYPPQRNGRDPYVAPDRRYDDAQNRRIDPDWRGGERDTRDPREPTQPIARYPSGEFGTGWGNNPPSAQTPTRGYDDRNRRDPQPTSHHQRTASDQPYRPPPVSALNNNTAFRSVQRTSGSYPSGDSAPTYRTDRTGAPAATPEHSGQPYEPNRNGTAAPGRTNSAGSSQRVSEFSLLDTKHPTSRPNQQELLAAPVFTGDALDSGLLDVRQYGLMGRVISIMSKDPVKFTEKVEHQEDPRLYINTNAPFSAVICGIQGSGKSHTVGALLENMLISHDSRLGSLTRPLSGLVLHFNQSVSGGAPPKPCEAAYVGVLAASERVGQGINGDGLSGHGGQAPRLKPPPVLVLVSPTNLNRMRGLYGPLGHNVVVEPLVFSEDEMDSQCFLSMMSVGNVGDQPPIYLQLVMTILRQLGERYTYQGFLDLLEEKKRAYHPAQLATLDQRLSLLNTFLRRTPQEPSSFGRDGHGREPTGSSGQYHTAREKHRSAPGSVQANDHPWATQRDPWARPPIPSFNTPQHASRDRSRERHRDSSRERSRNRSSSSSSDRTRRHHQPSRRSPDRYRGSSRERHRDRYRASSRDRDHYRDSSRERGRDSSRDRDRRRNSSADRDHHRGRGSRSRERHDRYRGSSRDRDRTPDKYRRGPYDYPTHPVPYHPERDRSFDGPRYADPREGARNVPGGRFGADSSRIPSGTTPRDAPLEQSRFTAGQLTIVDLSDPFIDAASACGLFEIMIRLFVRSKVGTGKFLIADEAHKYLASRGSGDLTKALVSLVRQQRHLAMRVIVSTQEPTVIPSVLLELSTLTFIHRFSSPSWWNHVASHLSTEFAERGLEHVVKLQTGEAIVLAPSGLGMFPGSTGRTLEFFGRRYLLVKTRKRVTADGGSSVLVVNTPRQRS